MEFHKKVNPTRQNLLHLANEIHNNPDHNLKIPDYLIKAAFELVDQVHLTAAFGDETANKLLDTIGE